MITTADTVLEVQRLLQAHQAWRHETLNLIASENTLSPLVRRALHNDWLGRYADYTGGDLHARRYQGTRYITQVEEIVQRTAGALFGARFVEPRPIAGHLAGIGVIMALCRPGDTILELSRDAGGHREAGKFNLPGLIDLKVQHLPFDASRYNIDVPAAQALIAQVKPRMVIFGSSNFLFPHPVRSLRQAADAHSPETLLIYDASHVLGLIAGGRFQAPLSEGADVIFSSTHKTFPGPQGGLILTNREDLIGPIIEAVYPGLVTNHHPFRMPALALALAEMQEFGPAYAAQIQANAQALGAALEAADVPCVQVDGLYSQSHTVLIKAAAFGKGSELAAHLEQANIITSGLALPPELGGESIRLGVQEITHYGAQEADMPTVAGLIADVLHRRRPPEAVAADVRHFTQLHDALHFCWPVE